MKQLLFVLAFVATGLFASSQGAVKKYRVGIFASLYLDSTFTGSTYKFTNQMPKHILPGLDFVQGALMAVDSVNSNQPLEVMVYDLRSADQSLDKLRSRNTFDSLDLMIGSVSGAEYRTLADLALLKNIPFVSATFPNDGGVTNNPFTIIVNSTLPAHCEAIYNFIMRSNPTANLVYVRRKGTQEDRLASYFAKYNKGSNGSTLLKWKTLNLNDNFTQTDLIPHLDSLKTNVLICGSLDEAFGLNLVNVAQKIYKTYPMELVGMPTWDGMKDLTKPEYKDLSLFYTATFFNTGTVAATNFTKGFTDLTNGRPSDVAYRGYELTRFFIQLLLRYNTQLMQHLNERTYRSFTEFDFRPVLNSTSGKPDYFENKRIYILKRSNNLVSRMN
ncbi:ABC-type branched-subunit amino acid transport system substrate-binding protein [Lacibacter cauensis]|uniref:ABC-type branched-subunit amino acid transport system substrate-binding protein n=1 Tax=Lacibacter cauensis TaxID=510947 RepID=A0A562SCX1_9BACT|nr:ABC transporter substrate-binding protein [Lacibacter cauensis]TWI78420.1 ABC-type branched-subunit amino acid transport system substrate-binding protein [Lacibacter cauensis]